MGPCYLRDTPAAKGGVVLVGGCRYLVEPRMRLDVADVIPLCWPQHPHLVHEIAVLADQRRRAGPGLTSDAL
jgi:hypothetical protein